MLINYLGCIVISIHEYYFAIFSTQPREKALEIIRQSDGLIDRVASLILRGEKFPQAAMTLGDKINSAIVNHLFYPLFVHAKKFYATDDCISCGKCVKACPLNNIRLENGKPLWGGHCTHCMACICRCPREAIEYGKHSKGLVRYICPK